MKKLYKEDLWNKILEEVELFSNDKTMEYYFKSNILNFNKLSDALSLLVSKNLKSQEINEENIIHDVCIAFTNKDIIETLQEDFPGMSSNPSEKEVFLNLRQLRNKW